jgi:hypothetical protein
VPSQSDPQTPRLSQHPLRTFKKTHLAQYLPPLRYVQGFSWRHEGLNRMDWVSLEAEKAQRGRVVDLLRMNRRPVGEGSISDNAGR